MVRWWWFGSTNTEQDIDQQLDAMNTAGIGGVELSFVYPVKAKQPFNFGSAEFVKLIRHASHGAKKRGMRFDFTIGSGWSFGGSHVTPEHAAQRLRFEDRTVGPDAREIEAGGRWPGDKLVAAWICDGAKGEQTDQYTPLNVSDKDVISVPAGRAPRTVLIATTGPTTQQLKRASNGAEGPTLNHYSREATLHHLEKIGAPFLAAAGAENVTSVFCDSLEVYHSDWTSSVPDDFTKRRGYDPIPLLYHLSTDKPEGADFRADYYRTLSELCEENFLAVCHDWARKAGTKFRVQNYGEPPVRISGYKHTDMIEGEGWGWTRIPETKWASSAAHHLGVQVVSSETWTWLNSPSFKARPLDFKGEAHEHVLCGINHFIGHGWPSSPLDIVDPGWAFYASCAITDRNAWWDAAAAPMFQYLHRLAEVMRQGTHVADIGVWMPYEDTYAGFKHDGEYNLWKYCEQRIGKRLPKELREAGYDFDVVDSGLSADSISERHSVVILAGSTRLSEADSACLDTVAKNGTKVIVIDSDILPQATHIKANGVLSALDDIIRPDLSTGDAAIGMVHRRLANGELYFIANTDCTAREAVLDPRTAYKRWERWDLHDGSVIHGKGEMRCTLAPYEAVVYVTSPEPTDASTDSAKTSSASRIALKDWTVRSTDLDNQGVQAPHTLREDFVGTATYTNTVTLSSSIPSHLVLDTSSLPTPSRSARRSQSFEAHAADPLGVVATVRINSQPAGVFWDPPYTLPVQHLLKEGENTVEIAVSTTSVALLRNPEWRKIWEETEKAHGRRFIMQEIEYAFEPCKAGLLVVPELR